MFLYIVDLLYDLILRRWYFTYQYQQHQCRSFNSISKPNCRLIFLFAFSFWTKALKYFTAYYDFDEITFSRFEFIYSFEWLEILNSKRKQKHASLEQETTESRRIGHVNISHCHSHRERYWWSCGARGIV